MSGLSHLDGRGRLTSYGQVVAIGLAVLFGAATSGYGCTAGDDPAREPSPDTPAAAATTGTPAPAATATAVPTPIVDLRIVGSEEFRARVRAALQLLSKRVPVALEQVERGNYSANLPEGSGR